MWHCKLNEIILGITAWFAERSFNNSPTSNFIPRRFLNWDFESFTTFQDAFDPFFRQLGHVLSLWLHRPARYVFSAALRALCSLSVGRQNNGAKGKKKTPCLSLIKGGRTFFFSHPLSSSSSHQTLQGLSAALVSRGGRMGRALRRTRPTPWATPAV